MKLTTNLILISTILVFPACAHAMWPFGGMIKAQLAEEMNGVKAQIASMSNKFDAKFTGIESRIDKVENKADGQAAAIVGVNDTITKVSSEIKTSAGRDAHINDPQLMNQYIQALKDAHTELVGVMWKIIYLLVIQLVGLVGAFGGYLYYTIKRLLAARDKEDVEDNEILRDVLKKERVV